MKLMLLSKDLMIKSLMEDVSKSTLLTPEGLHLPPGQQVASAEVEGQEDTAEMTHTVADIVAAVGMVNKEDIAASKEDIALRKEDIALRKDMVLHKEGILASKEGIFNKQEDMANKEDMAASKVVTAVVVVVVVVAAVTLVVVGMVGTAVVADTQVVDTVESQVVVVEEVEVVAAAAGTNQQGILVAVAVVLAVGAVTHMVPPPAVATLNMAQMNPTKVDQPPRPVVLSQGQGIVPTYQQIMTQKTIPAPRANEVVGHIITPCARVDISITSCQLEIVTFSH